MYSLKNQFVNKYGNFLFPMVITLITFLYIETCNTASFLALCIFEGRGLPLPYYTNGNFDWMIFLLDYLVILVIYFIIQIIIKGAKFLFKKTRSS